MLMIVPSARLIAKLHCQCVGGCGWWPRKETLSNYLSKSMESLVKMKHSVPMLSRSKGRQGDTDTDADKDKDADKHRIQIRATS